MRIFSFLGVFLLTGASFLIINGGLRLKHYINLGIASHELWTKEFWVAGSSDFWGLSPNAQWLLLICGGLFSATIGSIIIKVANRD